VFFDDWPRANARLEGAERILRSLVRLADKAQAA
jgi:hypothetical protein